MITAETTRAADRPMPVTGAARLTVREIARAVAAASELPVEAIFSRRRDQYAVTVRWAVMRIARRNGRTLSEIGRVLQRDHTTVLHGLQFSQRFGNYAPERARLLAAIEAEAAERLSQPPPVRDDLAPAAESPPLVLTHEQLPRILLLRRRGWSVAGIARYLGVQPEAIEIVIGARQP